MSSLEKNLIANRKILVCLGAGGVGKTTMAIALAFMAARQGKRVGLLSIDPAKRLAAALGISLSSELKKIPLPKGLFPEGSIDAAMIDQKAVFDDLVRRFTKRAVDRERIMANAIYQAASSGFGSALEYLALAKLQRMADSGDYDLVVLDTPPDSHALDFLSRPSVLSGFVDSKAMSWLIKPIHLAKKIGLGKLMTLGERLAGGIAAVTGVKALQLLAEFLVLMQDVIDGLQKSGERTLALLRQESTAFVLIATLKSSPVRSALNLAKELKAAGYDLNTVIINRCWPRELAASMAHIPAHLAAAGAAQPSLRALHNSYAVGRQLQGLLHDSLLRELGHEPYFHYFPEQNYQLQSLDGMIQFAAALNTGGDAALNS